MVDPRQWFSWVGLGDLELAGQTFCQPVWIVGPTHVNTQVEQHLVGGLMLHDESVEFLRQRVSRHPECGKMALQIAFLLSARSRTGVCLFQAFQSLLGAPNLFGDLPKTGAVGHVTEGGDVGLLVVHARHRPTAQTDAGQIVCEGVVAVEQDHLHPGGRGVARQAAHFAEASDRIVRALEPAGQRTQGLVRRVVRDDEVVGCQTPESLAGYGEQLGALLLTRRRRLRRRTRRRDQHGHQQADDLEPLTCHLLAFTSLSGSCPRLRPGSAGFIQFTGTVNDYRRPPVRRRRGFQGVTTDRTENLIPLRAPRRGVHAAHRCPLPRRGRRMGSLVPP